MTQMLPPFDSCEFSRPRLPKVFQLPTRSAVSMRYEEDSAMAERNNKLQGWARQSVI